MVSGLVVVHDIGIPIDEILSQIGERFNVGTFYNAVEDCQITAGLRKELAEAFLSTNALSDIPVLIYNICGLDFLTMLDQCCKVKVLIVTGNLYWRLRYWNSLGFDSESFILNTPNKEYQEILYARADAVLNLDKVLEKTDPLTLPNIISLLDRHLATLQIHSSKVRK